MGNVERATSPAALAEEDMSLHEICSPTCYAFPVQLECSNKAVETACHSALLGQEPGRHSLWCFSGEPPDFVRLYIVLVVINW